MNQITNLLKIKSMTWLGILTALYIAINLMLPIPLYLNTTLRGGAVVLGAYVILTRSIAHGFFVGFFGNIIIDIIMGYGIWLNWAIANGLFFGLLAILPLILKSKKIKDWIFNIGCILALCIVIYSLVGLSDVWLYESPAGITQALIIIPASLLQIICAWLLLKPMAKILNIKY